jgi:hypothetical protein
VDILLNNFFSAIKFYRKLSFDSVFLPIRAMQEGEEQPLHHLRSFKNMSWIDLGPNSISRMNNFGEILFVPSTISHAQYKIVNLYLPMIAC